MAIHPRLLGDNQIVLVPFGNTALHVDEIYPERHSGLLNTGGTVLNVFWFLVFGWWLCLSHILTGIAQCCTLISIPLGIANFKLALIAVWPVGRRVVSVEEADRLRADFCGPGGLALTLTIPLTLGVVAAALASLDDRLTGRLRNLLITLVSFIHRRRFH